MKVNVKYAFAAFAALAAFATAQAQAQWNSDFYHVAVQPNAQRPMNPGQTRANEERERRPSRGRFRDRSDARRSLRRANSRRRTIRQSSLAFGVSERRARLRPI